MSKSGKHWKHRQAKRRKNRKNKAEGIAGRISEQWNHSAQRKAA